MNDQAGGGTQIREVQAIFASPDRMQDAVSRLSVSGFDRADLSLPSRGRVEGAEGMDVEAKPASTDQDARQARTLGASTAAAAAALAAVGVTVATGGAAAPAAAAAAAGSVTAGGVAFAVHGTADRAEQHDRNVRAAEGDLVLAVRTTTAAKRTQAEAILRAAGATDVEAVSW